MPEKKLFILSLGGSLIVPDEIDVSFLKKFKKTIDKYIGRDYKFVIFCGGGKTARNTQKAASSIVELGNEELDWLGIYATRLNALLLRYIFGRNAQDPIITNANDRIEFKKNIIVAAGWLPGSSTDYDAVIVAKKVGASEIINISNIDFIYDKDPKKFRNAKKIEKISWKELISMIGAEWKAGMNAPFDPIAAKEAMAFGIKVNVIGDDMENFENLLEGRKFKGTVIE